MTLHPSRIDYHARLARVTAYIHDHLADPIELDRLAEIAHLSPYHWHRIYHALLGETIAATVRRLRLQQGAGYLAHTTHPIERIARLCGYDNAQSFTRAFRQTYGSSPSHWRRRTQPQELATSGTQVPPEQGWTVQLREVPLIHLAGQDHRGPYMKIGKAFETAQVHVMAQGISAQPMRMLAQYCDDPFAYPAAQLRSRAGLVVQADTPTAEPLIRFTVGGCTCAVLRYQGPYAGMREAYRWLYGRWLPESGRLPADQPVFEEYLNDPRQTRPGELLSEILLPLAD